MRTLSRQEFLNYTLRDDNEGLKLGDFWIMPRFEEGFIKESIRQINNNKRLALRLRKIDSVCELGFGYGYTAEIFQQLGVTRHVIIEAHPEIAERARQWAMTNYPDKNIEIIEGFWQEYQTDEVFDLLYDDTFEVVFSGEPDYSNIRHKIFSKFCDDAPVGVEDNSMWTTGIWFSFNGQKRFQPISLGNYFGSTKDKNLEG